MAKKKPATDIKPGLGTVKPFACIEQEFEDVRKGLAPKKPVGGL